MSTGRRLAKRSIIGTKVCAPGPDGLWYSGVIQDVKTPPTSTVTTATSLGEANNNNNLNNNQLNDNITDNNGTSVNSNTKYIVRFDFKTMQGGLESSSYSNTYLASASNNNSNINTNNIHLNNNLMASPKSVIMEARRVFASPAQTLRRNAMIKEFRESDLIGPGFRSIIGIQLQPGQRVFLTYNGRETCGDVLSHDAEKDEVNVKVLAIGNEEPIELKIRLEEVRLLESRRSARLADQDRDTDFARLADMGGDRRRTSNSIEVPMPLTPQNNSRKRPQSYTTDYNEDQNVETDECTAALILMGLSNSPKSQRNAEICLASSPYSSSASWSSGSSSPPLSDDGIALLQTNATILNDAAASARIRTISVSTSDEGIDVDYPYRRKRAYKSRFKCTYRGCNYTDNVQLKIEKHIRNTHLGNKKPRRFADDESDHEEEFYYTEIEDDDDDVKPSPTSPTLSHRDMARPPHEDPEYQRQIVGNFKQGRVISHQQQLHNNNGAGIKSQHHNNNGPQYHQLQSLHQQQLQNNNTICMPTSSPLAHHNYTWPSPNNNNNNSNVLQTQHHNTVLHHQQQLQSTQQHHNHNNTASLIKRVHHNSPRPSQAASATATAAPYPSPPPPAYVQHQLSQQNVTVTVTTSPNHHHNTNGSHHQQQQHNQNQNQHQMPTGQAVTITSSLAATTNVTSNNNNNYHSQHQQNHHSMQQQQQQHSPNGNSNLLSSNSAHHHQQQQQHMLQHHHQQQQQHTAAMNNSTVRHPPNNNSSPPNRRTRGENKKCRKVYGMQRRDQWCTQCKWKKACSRFGD